MPSCIVGEGIFVPIILPMKPPLFERVRTMPPADLGGSGGA